MRHNSSNVLLIPNQDTIRLPSQFNMNRRLSRGVESPENLTTVSQSFAKRFTIQDDHTTQIAKFRFQHQLSIDDPNTVMTVSMVSSKDSSKLITQKNQLSSEKSVPDNYERKSSEINDVPKIVLTNTENEKTPHPAIKYNSTMKKEQEEIKDIKEYSELGVIPEESTFVNSPNMINTTDPIVSYLLFNNLI